MGANQYPTPNELITAIAEAQYELTLASGHWRGRALLVGKLRFRGATPYWCFAVVTPEGATDYSDIRDAVEAYYEAG